MSQPVCSSLHPEPGSRQSEIIPTTTGVGMRAMLSNKENMETPGPSSNKRTLLKNKIEIENNFSCVIFKRCVSGPIVTVRNQFGHFWATHNDL